MTINFKALGGGDEIGANSYLLDINGQKVVLDCGLHPRKSGPDMFPDYAAISNEVIQHLIISHAHNDHIGALPYFLKLFPYAKIYSTRPTLSIAEITLGNTAFLMEREFEGVWDKSFIKYYTEEILNLIPMIMKQYHYNEVFNLNEDVEVEFFHAGHILGAAGVMLRVREDGGVKKVFYTGDFSLRDQKLITGGDIPREHIDVLITECTNGESPETPSYDSQERLLTGFINRVINDGGSVLIPVFALGKSQEFLVRVMDMMEKNKIPKVTVYYSSLSRALNGVYDDFNYDENRVEKGYKLGGLDFNKIRRSDIKRGNFYKEPSIILATSGMVIEGTGSYRIAKHILPMRNFGIAMCGYCDPDTPGYKIKNAERGDRIFLDKFGIDEVDVRCSIENFRFTSHASPDDIMTMVQKLNPKKVVLVHGDEGAIDVIGHRILTEYPHMKVQGVEKMKNYEL
jgi:cleavage and polyadenylation specificity factor subunit 3